MEIKSYLSKVYIIMFALFTLGYGYTYASILSLFLVSVPVGLFAAIIYPLVIYGVFILFSRWMSRDFADEGVGDYPTVASYMRVWRLSFELMLIISSTLVIAWAVPTVWLRAILWLVAGIGLLFFYSRYLNGVLEDLSLSDALYTTLQRRYLMVSSIYGAFAMISGLATILLSLIGRWIS